MPSVLKTVRSGATQHSEEMLATAMNKQILASGVNDRNDNDLLVEQSDTPAMSVDIRQGHAFLRVSDGSMVYPVWLDDADATVTIDANSSGNSRIDAVVLYVDLGASPNTDATNVATLDVINGTPAASPVAPTDSAISTAIGASNPFIRLADVTVANAAASITNSNITDRRNAAKRMFSLAEEIAGWRPLGYEATRASATTMTVAGVDLTSILQKGMKLRFRQPTDGVKYAYIVGVSFSTDTTITITSGSLYDLDNEAIYNLYYSEVDGPMGFPGEFPWTPSGFSGFSADPTGGLYYFTIRGQILYWSIRQPNNGTSNGTGFSLNLPVTSANVDANMQWGGFCSIVVNNGTSEITGSWTVTNNSATLTLSRSASSTGWTNSGNKRLAAATGWYRI